MTALVVLEALVILLLLVLVAGLLRSHAEILRRLDALGAGEDMDAGVPFHRRRARGTAEAVPVEAITGVTPTGGAASISLQGSRGYLLLAFLSSGCASCKAFWEGFSNGIEMPRPDLRPVIVTRGPENESPAAIAALSSPEVMTLMSDAAWDGFRVPGTPYFQLVDGADGRVVGEGSAGSWPRVVELIQRSLADADHRRIHLSTEARLRDSDEELRRAGLRPGDPSLFEHPDRK